MMRSLWFASLLLCLHVLFLTAREPSRAPDWAARLDDAVAEQMKATDAVGCAVGVIEDNRIVYFKGYGLADREKNIPVDAKTMFRWASVSKTITAVAAMQLVEMELLDLDRDIRDYVPEFPDKGAKITTRQLLGHLGGIVHYVNGKVIRTQRNYEKPNPFADVVLALDTFKESPLVCLPGEKYSYSTHGYILLSAVVERAGRQRFADQVKERICQPLGLKSLRPDYQWETIPNRAVGYRKAAGQIIPSTNTDVSWKLGGGGFISTIDDMARFAEGLLQKKLLKPETFQQMWTRQKTADGKETGYGLGFGVSTGAGGLAVSHSGSQEKTKTLLTLRPDQKRALVFMTNSEFVNPGQFVQALRQAIWSTP
jgi:serine beta-lactamase-like protein LACTB